MKAEITFNREEFDTLYDKIFKENGLERFINDDIRTKFADLTDFLFEYNSHTNLTAIRDISGVILKHYVDSLMGERYLPKSAKVIDIGAGAGFPSLPIAIVRPDIKITAVDSTAKKTRFTQLAAEKLSIDNITAISARAEELAMTSEYRERFDCAVSRAVARLNILSELCIPFVREGGSFIAYKAYSEEETSEALSAFGALGGKLSGNEEVCLASGDESAKRSIIIIQKTRPTPKIYPRNFSRISKKPL